MKFSNQTQGAQIEHVNPQTAAILLSYGFSKKANSFQWAKTDKQFAPPVDR